MQSLSLPKRAERYSSPCVPKELLSDGDVEELLQVTGCSSELKSMHCDTDCLSERYRSITGECNNRSVLSAVTCHHSNIYLLNSFKSVIVCVGQINVRFRRV